MRGTAWKSVCPATPTTTAVSTRLVLIRKKAVAFATAFLFFYLLAF